MKVIEEIISYLADRNLLTEQQMAELDRKGFYSQEAVICESSQSPGISDSSDDAETIDLLHARADAEQDKQFRRPSGGGKRNARRSTAKERRIVKQISEGLKPLISVKNKGLSGFIKLAKRIESGISLWKAPVVVRNAHDDEFFDVVCDCLRDRNPGLDTLWDFICYDEYLRPKSVREKAGAGSIVEQYRLLLSPGCPSISGRYGRLLKSRRINWVYNLYEVQKKLLRAFGRIYREKRILLDQNMVRDFHIMPYLVFGLVYTLDSRTITGGDAGSCRLPATYDKLLCKAYELGTVIDNKLVSEFMCILPALNNHLFIPSRWYHSKFKTAKYQQLFRGIKITKGLRRGVHLYNEKGICKLCGVTREGADHFGWHVCDKNS